MRPRRESRLASSVRADSFLRSSFIAGESRPSRGTWPSRRPQASGSEDKGVEMEEERGSDEEAIETDDRTPLIAPSSAHPPSPRDYGTDNRTASHESSRAPRQPSVDTAASLRRTWSYHPNPADALGQDRDYDVNNPPSIPGSPTSGAFDMGYDDAVVTGVEFGNTRPSEACRDSTLIRPHDAIIEIDPDLFQAPSADLKTSLSSPSRSRSSSSCSPCSSPANGLHRRRTVALPAEGDVCFPTELAEEFELQVSPNGVPDERRRRRHRVWPDLEVLDQWSREEKEERNGELRAKKISEPVLVGGRLRPQYAAWRRQEDEAPYRFTYFNEDFPSTIHAQTVSELVQPGGSFRELFIPDPPELEDSSSDEEHDVEDEEDDDNDAKEEDLIIFHEPAASSRNGNSSNGGNDNKTHQPLRPVHHGGGSRSLPTDTKSNSDPPRRQKPLPPKPKRYGPRPTWWLDVLCPTDAEMRVISKAFGIHALTAEDIMMQEAREKVELFRNYYFVNYRTFEQDSHSENYLNPVNMYIVVFREGVLSFHFSQTPHLANVRRRIRQLRDYLILSSDWISYALIDDITDVFGPLIQSIENEVDDIDDTIMRMHTANPARDPPEDAAPQIGAGELLRRVGDCRRKVMGMFRLLSNKADVIKGFAKRCNEQWEVAPKSEIGLYLGDIQDHIMTMTSNLAHYETILSRAHSNYLAQINIAMNERQERTADVLGKLTVLGTIVLPMNIICGMWGMNVRVPGQEVDSLYWFWSITAGLVMFGVLCFYVAKRVYRIV
ncbi:hypothetical protein V8E54_003517 [Elaphomyces granulatus]